MIARSIGTLAIALLATSAQAIPVVLTYTLSDVTYNDGGVADGLGYGRAVTGDWIFKANYETTTPTTGVPDLMKTYRITDLTLTQASLGLFDAEIVNLVYLKHGHGDVNGDRIGFTSNESFGARAYVEMTHEFGFPNSHPFRGDYGPVSGPSSFGGVDGFIFADGRVLAGSGFTSTSTFGSAVAPVPEPETWAAMMLGLVALFGRRMAARRQAGA